MCGFFCLVFFFRQRVQPQIISKGKFLDIATACLFLASQHRAYAHLGFRHRKPLRLRLRGRASVLLLEGCWFDPPGLHVEMSLGKILLKPTLLCWSVPCMAATIISVWINVINVLWTKNGLLNALKSKLKVEGKHHGLASNISLGRHKKHPDITWLLLRSGCEHQRAFSWEVGTRKDWETLSSTTPSVLNILLSEPI